MTEPPTDRPTGTRWHERLTVVNWPLLTYSLEKAAETKFLFFRGSVGRGLGKPATMIYFVFLVLVSGGFWLGIASKAEGFGRFLLVIGCVWQLITLFADPINLCTGVFVRERENRSLELSLLACGAPRTLVVTLGLPPYLTVTYRLLAPLPLLGIAASCGALTWADLMRWSLVLHTALLAWCSCGLLLSTLVRKKRHAEILMGGMAAVVIVGLVLGLRVKPTALLRTAPLLIPENWALIAFGAGILAVALFECTWRRVARSVAGHPVSARKRRHRRRPPRGKDPIDALFSAAISGTRSFFDSRLARVAEVLGYGILGLLPVFGWVMIIAIVSTRAARMFLEATSVGVWDDVLLTSRGGGRIPRRVFRLFFRHALVAAPGLAIAYLGLIPNPLGPTCGLGRGLIAAAFDVNTSAGALSILLACVIGGAWILAALHCAIAMSCFYSASHKALKERLGNASGAGATAALAGVLLGLVPIVCADLWCEPSPMPGIPALSAPQIAVGHLLFYSVATAVPAFVGLLAYGAFCRRLEPFLTSPRTSLNELEAIPFFGSGAGQEVRRSPPVKFRIGPRG